MRLGIYIYGLATIATGILDLIWGEFEPGHQPIQAWGDHIPGQRVFAYIAAIWLIAAGTAILWRRSARWGARASARIYFIFAVFWLPRFYTAPHLLGAHIGLYLGVLVGVGLVAAALIIYALARRGSAPRWALAPAVRWVFGLCSVDFGLAHLTGVQGVAPLVPKWIPMGGDFWAVLTGIAFILAGLAIVIGIFDVVAARLLALMLLVFSALALAPHLLTSPHSHLAWGGNAYNLVAVGAGWIVAEYIASQRIARDRLNRAPLAQAP
jgi:uncharacterized membrane protein